MSSAADVLERAAELLERDGWCQRQLHHCDGSRCVRGAIIDAALEVGEGSLPPSEWLRRHLGAKRSLPEWNDDPGRTADEVIAKLREAAKVARGGGL